LPSPTLFPYTTLFRSRVRVELVLGEALVVPDVDGLRHVASLTVVSKGNPPPMAADGFQDAGGFEGGAGARIVRHQPVGILPPKRSEEHTSELQSRSDL